MVLDCEQKASNSNETEGTLVPLGPNDMQSPVSLEINATSTPADIQSAQNNCQSIHKS